jgi:hypothetical protein
MNKTNSLPLIVKEGEKFVLDLPFSDGKRVKIVLGSTMPDFDEWLNGDDSKKALCARMYFAAAAYTPISSDEFYSLARNSPLAGTTEG